MASSTAEQPALPPPPGMTPDFDGRYIGLQPTIVGILSLCLVLSTLTLAARLVVKRFVLKAVRVEDCTFLWITLVFEYSLRADIAICGWVRNLHTR